MISRRDVVKAGLAGSAALGLAPFQVRSVSAQAPTSLQIFVPAAPGGGWDQTGRTIELALWGAGSRFEPSRVTTSGRFKS